jgi:LacI family transcriptional regulator
MPSRKKSVTLKDIAEAAGVTPGTVSFVVTNTYEERRISLETVERVRRIARELGYVPNIAARNLRFADRNKSMLVLAIITSAGAPLNLVSHLFEALQRRIRVDRSGRHFVINVSTFNPGKLHLLPGILDGSRFNGAIITNTQPLDDSFLESTVLPFPSLVIGRELQGYACFVPSVNAGRVAAEMLHEAGVGRPAVLYEEALTQATERRVTQFCTEFGTRYGAQPARIVASVSSEMAASEALEGFLAAGKVTDGIFAVHDNLAAGAYLTLRRRGLKIPAQVRVVGMGDSDWPPFLDPPLSCAGAEESSVYDEAAQMILEACLAAQPKPTIACTQARAMPRGST